MSTPFLKLNLKKIVRLAAEEPAAGADCHFKGPCAIGAYSYVGERSSVSFTRIGRYCSIASDVIIGPTDHPTDRFSTHLIAFGNRGPFKSVPEFDQIMKGTALVQKKDGTQIGNDVWIGANVVIRRGVKIGDGAIIGAGAVVTKDVKPYAIVGGVPAAFIRFRFSDDMVARFANLKWWDYSLDEDFLTKAEFDDANAFLDAMETAKEKGLLRPLDPRCFLISDGQIVETTLPKVVQA